MLGSGKTASVITTPRSALRALASCYISKSLRSRGKRGASAFLRREEVSREGASNLPFPENTCGLSNKWTAFLEVVDSQGVPGLAGLKGRPGPSMVRVHSLHLGRRASWVRGAHLRSSRARLVAVAGPRPGRLAFPARPFRACAARPAQSGSATKATLAAATRSHLPKYNGRIEPFVNSGAHCGPLHRRARSRGHRASTYCYRGSAEYPRLGGPPHPSRLPARRVQPTSYLVPPGAASAVATFRPEWLAFG